MVWKQTNSVLHWPKLMLSLVTLLPSWLRVMVVRCFSLRCSVVKQKQSLRLLASWKVKNSSKVSPMNLLVPSVLYPRMKVGRFNLRSLKLLTPVATLLLVVRCRVLFPVHLVWLITSTLLRVCWTLTLLPRLLVDSSMTLVNPLRLFRRSKTPSSIRTSLTLSSLRFPSTVGSSRSLKTTTQLVSTCSVSSNWLVVRISLDVRLLLVSPSRWISMSTPTLTRLPPLVLLNRSTQPSTTPKFSSVRRDWLTLRKFWLLSLRRLTIFLVSLMVLLSSSHSELKVRTSSLRITSWLSPWMVWFKHLANPSKSLVITSSLLNHLSPTLRLFTETLSSTSCRLLDSTWIPSVVSSLNWVILLTVSHLRQEQKLLQLVLLASTL